MLALSYFSLYLRVRRVACMGDRGGEHRGLVGELIERDRLKDLSMDMGWVGIAWIALA